MEALLFQTFVLIGSAFILKYGSILNFARKPLTEKFEFFQKLFKCALCLGFWIGLFFGIFFGNPFLWALYSSAVCWFADHVIMIAQKHLYPPVD